MSKDAILKNAADKSLKKNYLDLSWFSAEFDQYRLKELALKIQLK